jgi:hypothetical protein
MTTRTALDLFRAGTPILPLDNLLSDPALTRFELAVRFSA